MVLTRGERLTIYRRRQGLTQQEIADELGVQQNDVSEWETGKKDVLFAALPEIEPNEAEQARVLRRRFGWTINQAAAKFGVTHVTIIDWETHVKSATLSYLSDLEEVARKRGILI